MKQLIAMLLALVLAMIMVLSLLTGCSKTVTAKTPEELNKLYTDAITANGGEMVEYNPVISEAKEEDGSAFLLEMMGLKAEDMVSFGISTSMMNTKAFGIKA